MSGDDVRRLLPKLLASLKPIPTQDDVWREAPYDVPQLNGEVTRRVLVELDGMRAPDAGQPYGVAVLGSAGAGKTHLLRALRQQIQAQAGYFFLVSLNGGRSFWTSMALAISDGFRRQSLSGATQHKIFFRRLGDGLRLARRVRDAVAGDAPLSPDHLETFIRELRKAYPEIDWALQQTARALVLLAAEASDVRDIGEMFFASEPLDAVAAQRWGLPTIPRTPQELVRDTSRLIALTRSPCLIALDQTDFLFAEYDGTPTTAAEMEASDVQEAALLTQGLVDLLDRTQRTLVVLTCTPTSWVLINNVAPLPFTTRFREEPLAEQIADPAVAREIIARRFAPVLADQNPEPGNATWPIRPEAFGATIDLNPRELIRRVYAHLRECVLDDEVRVLTDIMAGTTVPWGSGPGVTEEPPDFGQFDAEFKRLVADADISGAFVGGTEDQVLRDLLAAGLATWIDEQPHGNFLWETPAGDSPAIHARLVQILGPTTNRQATWSFRGIASSHHLAVISRVKKATHESGIDSELADRRLFLLRRDDWPKGKRTEEVVGEAVRAGAVTIRDFEEDLRVFAALKAMRSDNKEGLTSWLAQRRPASNTNVLRDIIPVTGDDRPASSSGQAGAKGRSAGGPAGSGASAPAIELGRLVTTGETFTVPLASLCRHMAIFAGSGSGKTVLIKRVVEECALRGVSSIVLDVNNDLARFGEAWPEPPETGWGPDDPARAAEYLAHTEVVVWTPGVNAGRQLSFRPLPEFGTVLDNDDEFALAVGSAVDALAPRVNAAGSAEKSKKRRAVLTKAVEAFARSGETGVSQFRHFLANLPDGVTKIANGQKIAGELADLLQAEMDIDPLLRDGDAVADPGVLVTPTPGKRARVSVISFIGLTEGQRQSFVGQLQVALFNWVKQHPAAAGSLGWLLVIDEAQNYAPATGITPSTSSTILLAQQARKYGLGLILATQAPKGVHNQVTGNARTQFFGLLNSGAHIQAARELAAAKGEKLTDIGKLKAGQFYVTNEDEPFTRVDMPLCLSYHAGALPPDEVIERARREP